MNKLQIVFKRKSHPYSNEKSSKFEIWCEIAFVLEDKTLIIFEWDILPFAEWFCINYDCIVSGRLAIKDKKTKLVYKPQKGETLCDTLGRLTIREFENENDDAEFERIDDWSEQIFCYRSQHDLHFAFPGADIEEILIGVNEGGGELSFCNRIQNNTYKFDMKRFCIDLAKDLYEILDSAYSDENFPQLPSSTEIIESLLSIQSELEAT